MNPPTFDIGLNLSSDRFRNDLHDVLERAFEAGVAGMLLTGSNAADSRAARALCDHHPERLWSTSGCHPHDAARCDDAAFAAITKLATDPQVRAIGECGLDFNRDFSPRDDQEAVFRRHLGLARDTGKPLFLHERDAAERFLAIVDEEDGPFHGVVHCFTGDEATMHAYLERGYHIGITGWICDERRGTHLRSLVRDIPADRLLIETDAPYLTPRTLRPKPKGGRNEPAFLPHIAAAIAECRGESLDELASATTANARRLFGVE